MSRDDHLPVNPTGKKTWDDHHHHRRYSLVLEDTPQSSGSITNDSECCLLRSMYQELVCSTSPPRRSDHRSECRWGRLICTWLPVDLPCQDLPAIRSTQRVQMFSFPSLAVKNLSCSRESRLVEGRLKREREKKKKIKKNSSHVELPRKHLPVDGSWVVESSFFLFLFPFCGNKTGGHTAEHTDNCIHCMHVLCSASQFTCLKRSNIRLLSKPDRIAIRPSHQDERLYMVIVSCVRFILWYEPFGGPSPTAIKGLMHQ